MVTILDGRKLAQERQEHLKHRIAQLKHPICLATVLVGDHPASQLYVRRKIEACARVGMLTHPLYLPRTISQEQLNQTLRTLSADSQIHGILLQLPLPAHLDATQALHCIHPLKDVDGLHPHNFGALWQGLDPQEYPYHTPCTPQGCLALIHSVRSPSMLTGLHAVIIGRSRLVGSPMAALLLQQNMTVTLAHSHTQNLPELCQTADILVVAAGQPQMIHESHIKPGAIVIDVGIHYVPAGAASTVRLCGDVALDTTTTRAAALSPVPGGVGPLTIQYLLENTYKAALLRRA